MSALDNGLSYFLLLSDKCQDNSKNLKIWTEFASFLSVCLVSVSTLDHEYVISHFPLIEIRIILKPAKFQLTDWICSFYLK